MNIRLLLALLPCLKFSLLGVLQALLEFTLFVILAIFLDPFDHSLLVLLARLKHLMILGFDSVHQLLIESLLFLSLGLINVPDDVCKLLVVVELGEKDVLFCLIGALFKSNRMKSIDEEAFN